MTIARAGFVLMVSFGAGRWTAVAAGGAPPVTSAPASPDVGDLDRAVADLGDARWEVRRAAGFRLIDAGEAALPALRRAYLEGRRHETRLRIRELVEAIFAETHGLERGAFLGVRQRPRLRQMDPRVPEGCSWVEVLQVFRDTAADRAGLRAGDLIVACDGTTFPEDPPGQVCGRMVSRHRPGTEVLLEVRRAPGTGEPLPLRVRLGRRPMAVLAEADPGEYAVLRAAFDAGGEEGVSPAASRPAGQSATTTRAAGRPGRP